MNQQQARKLCLKLKIIIVKKGDEMEEVHHNKKSLLLAILFSLYIPKIFIKEGAKGVKEYYNDTYKDTFIYYQGYN